MQQSDKTKPIASEDLLAGLRSQAGKDEEEDVPDWLANITGAQPTPRSEQNDPSESRRVEMGGREDFPQDEPSGDVEVPSWLAGLQSPEALPEKDELTDWFGKADETPEPFKFDASLDTSTESSSEASSTDLPANDTPDWLRQMALDADSESERVEASTSQDAPELPIDAPDWLSNLGGMAEQTSSFDSASLPETGTSESEAQDLSSDIPEWLQDKPKSKKSVQDTTPPWLKESAAGGASESDMPAWLSSSEETVRLPSEQEAEPTQDDVLADLPDWLKAAAPESSIFAQQAAEPESSSEESDRLKVPGTSAAPQAEGTSTFESSAPFEDAPAFTPDNGEMEGLFSEIPDWLSNAIDSPSTGTSSLPGPTPITNEDALAPSDLPSWVQAMRPVEPSLSDSSFASDQTLESRGALAGLQGVLPATPGFAPTSKPKAYSVKLNASEEQLKHAEILEQILAGETSPVPLTTFAALRTSRSLRWLLTAVIVSIIFVALLLPAPIFSVPVGVPSEIRNIRETLFTSQPIPENSPVLVAFDYEPARAAEMELAATPMLDLLILLTHPRFTFISTNETGSILAERFISHPIFVEHFNNGGFVYSNLGYLPGGQLGIRVFAQSPKIAAPLDISLTPAWTSDPDINSLSQFAAMILITDNAEAARAWVEQTQGMRGGIPFIVVSSAQAAPMIQPYYDSGQVTGIVSGLYGGAIFEQYNAGRPGTARHYWDAYSLGMLLAMSLVLGGGMWNLALGLRDRAAAREVK